MVRVPMPVIVPMAVPMAVRMLVPVGMIVRLPVRVAMAMPGLRGAGAGRADADRCAVTARTPIAAGATLVARHLVVRTWPARHARRSARKCWRLQTMAG
jgi:hypothetical protein